MSARRVVAIVQARMGSSRLPGKVVADVAGKPLIAHVVDRVRASRTVDAVVLATTDRDRDTILADTVSALGVPVFRGSESDVLDRYLRAAREHRADVVVRVTGDCPLIDPDVLDRCVDVFMDGPWEYVSNTQPPTYPDGLDVEVLAFGALQTAWREASLPSEREHVTPYIWKHPDRFRLSQVRHETDLSRMRWIVDEAEDLAFVRRIWADFPNGEDFRLADVLELLARDPRLAELNSMYRRNEGYAASLVRDPGVGASSLKR